MSATTEATSPAPSKALHYGLWALQGLLAFMFFMAGANKIAQAPEALTAMGMSFVARMPAGAPKVIGLLEVLGAIGLILPSALRIAPKVSALAAAGLVLTMVVAAADHGMHGEFGPAGFTVFLAALAGFIVWGRAVGAPIAPR